ncbi:(2Fe-2S)-binding protein [Geoglobus sp.]
MATHLCYCKQVTEEDVIGAIRRDAKSVKEVEEITGIGNGCHCIVTNP